jgi:elongation factor Ts
MDTKLLMQLREKTGAPITACQQVLASTQGDLEKAAEILKQKGLEVVQKKTGRETSQGIIDAYIHQNARVGALIQVHCETDFVARSPEFKEFVHDLAMQVTASSPLYLATEDIPAEIIEKQRRIILDEVAGSGKPPQIIEQMAKGKLEKWQKEVCLLNQPFIKDEEVTIQGLLQEKIAKFGENIKIKQFIRFSF